MKLLLAVILTALICTSSASAFIYWQRSSPGVYSCEGASEVVQCKSQSYLPRYAVQIDRQGLRLAFHGRVFFSCATRTYPAACFDFRR